MSGDILLLIVIFIAGIATIIIFIGRKISSVQSKDMGKEMLMLQQQIGQINQTLDQKLSETKSELDRKLSETNKITREQFQEGTQFMSGISKDSQEMLHKISQQSQEMVKGVTERLTKLDETNKQVIGFSEQLSSLEKVLKSQKQRGSLGEAGLKLVLENILPPDAFSLQYQFDDGDKVDAAIFTKDGIIPIDAKFSLENYNRIVDEENEDKREYYKKEFKNDLKKRINETSKYVKPNKGTLDFAFMFIPAEAIYYDLLVNEVGVVKGDTRSLIDYASKEKNVVIVSPTTFSAYLKTVLFGLQALKIEEQAKTIQSNVEKFSKHLNVYESFHEKLGNSLATTVNHYKKSHKELGKIDKDIMKITGNEKTLRLEEVEIESPKNED
ncbi:MAG: DNA recombination protein RmuC [Patescibacteria group bacterium]|nr:DNA recombination protein RmuC [Patescibacteria group bacterium]